MSPRVELAERHGFEPPHGLPAIRTTKDSRGSQCPSASVHHVTTRVELAERQGFEP